MNVEKEVSRENFKGARRKKGSKISTVDVDGRVPNPKKVVMKFSKATLHFENLAEFNPNFEYPDFIF